MRKPKHQDKLLTLRLSNELEFAIDAYCLNHLETNKSSFIRDAIKEKLEQVTNNTSLRNTWPPSEKVSGRSGRPSLSSMSNKVSHHGDLKNQWIEEQRIDIQRQRGSQEK